MAQSRYIQVTKNRMVFAGMTLYKIKLVCKKETLSIIVSSKTTGGPSYHGTYISSAIIIMRAYNVFFCFQNKCAITLFTIKTTKFMALNVLTDNENY